MRLKIHRSALLMSGIMALVLASPLPCGATTSGIDTPPGVYTLPLAVEGNAIITLTDNPTYTATINGNLLSNGALTSGPYSYVQTGNTSAACDGALRGAIRFNTATNVFEGCNGSAWGPFSCMPGEGGHATFMSPGTYTFTVPSTYCALTVQLWGAGGGGGGANGAKGHSGGGQSAFLQSVAGGGGVAGSAAGAGGTASGGDLNLNGFAPLNSGNGVGVGGNNGAAASGAGVSFDGGAWGSSYAGNTGSPGGGGTGAGFPVGYGGGGGAYVIKTYLPGELPPGSMVQVGVGQAGVGFAGGLGGNGQVIITWK